MRPRRPTGRVSRLARPVLGYLAAGVPPAQLGRAMQLLALAAIVLAGLVLVSAGLAVARIALHQLPAAIPPAAAIASEDAGGLSDAVDLALLAALQRPLFTPSRRPPADASISVAETAAPVEESAASELEDVRLLGLYSDGTYTQGVIVLVGAQRRRLLLGESHEGWRLVDVQNSGAVFEGNGQRVVVPLEFASGADVQRRPAGNRSRTRRNQG